MLGISPEEANNLLRSNYSHKYLEDYYTKKWEQEVKNVREIGIYSGSPFNACNQDIHAFTYDCPSGHPKDFCNGYTDGYGDEANDIIG